MKARRDVFQAIADPTRRAIINLISVEPRDIKSIAGEFDITQQAISLQVKILADCGLLYLTKRGRNRFCTARLDKLSEIDIWVRQYRQHWESRLDAMESYIQKLKKQRNGKRKH
jgi:DNA-binding transcriptional ArsR family regulator